MNSKYKAPDKGFYSQGSSLVEQSVFCKEMERSSFCEHGKRLALHPALLLHTAGISNVWVLCGDKSACPHGRALRDRYHGWEKKVFWKIFCKNISLTNDALEGGVGLVFLHVHPWPLVPISFIGSSHNFLLCCNATLHSFWFILPQTISVSLRFPPYQSSPGFLLCICSFWLIKIGNSNMQGARTFQDYGYHYIIWFHSFQPCRIYCAQ